VSERGRRYLVLERAEHGKRLFRQQVGARAEELPKFNQQDTELYRRCTEGYQHLD
jgi:hypothetical protein